MDRIDRRGTPKWTTEEYRNVSLEDLNTLRQDAIEFIYGWTFRLSEEELALLRVSIESARFTADWPKTFMNYTEMKVRVLVKGDAVIEETWGSETGKHAILQIDLYRGKVRVDYHDQEILDAEMGRI